jgi:hypothetical protein
MTPSPLRSRGSRRRYSPLGIPSLLFFNDYTTVTPTDAIVNAAGTKTITGAAPTMVVSIAGSGITSAYPGSTAKLSGYASPGNNGSFTITDVTTSSLTVRNPAGVPEVGPGSARVDVLGLCSSATDMLSGRVFTQTTHADKWAVNDSLVPGKNVLCTGLANTMGRFMTVVDAALAGALNGLQPFTMFVHIYPVLFNAQTGITSWMQFEDAAAVSMAASRVAGANTQRCFTVDAAGGAGGTSDISISTGSLALTTWQLWAVTCDGPTARAYVNGILVGSMPSLAKTRSALTRVVLSNRSGGTTGLVGTRHYRALEGAAARAMSAAELLQLAAYCHSKTA